MKTTYQGLWDIDKTVLWGKFICVNAKIKKKERSQTKNLSFYLKKLQKEEQTKPTARERKEIKTRE